jgi:hypothetical protein
MFSKADEWPTFKTEVPQNTRLTFSVQLECSQDTTRVCTGRYKLENDEDDSGLDNRHLKPLRNIDEGQSMVHYPLVTMKADLIGDASMNRSLEGCCRR